MKKEVNQSLYFTESFCLFILFLSASFFLLGVDAPTKKEQKNMDYPKSHSWVGLKNGAFVNPNPQTGESGSYIPAETLNALVQEVIHAIIALGGVPLENTNNQLAEALTKGNPTHAGGVIRQPQLFGIRSGEHDLTSANSELYRTGDPEHRETMTTFALPYEYEGVPFWKITASQPATMRFSVPHLSDLVTANATATIRLSCFFSCPASSTPTIRLLDKTKPNVGLKGASTELHMLFIHDRGSSSFGGDRKFFKGVAVFACPIASQKRPEGLSFEIALPSSRTGDDFISALAVEIVPTGTEATERFINAGSIGNLSYTQEDISRGMTITVPEVYGSEPGEYDASTSTNLAVIADPGAPLHHRTVKDYILPSEFHEVPFWVLEATHASKVRFFHNPTDMVATNHSATLRYHCFYSCPVGKDISVRLENNRTGTEITDSETRQTLMYTQGGRDFFRGVGVYRCPLSNKGRVSRVAFAVTMPSGRSAPDFVTLVSVDVVAPATTANNHFINTGVLGYITHLSQNTKQTLSDHTPVGAIIAVHANMSGATALPSSGTIGPGGWMRCDGATNPVNGQRLPYLTDGRFLRGASSSGSTGGTESFTIIKDNLPDHVHNMGHKHSMPHSHGVNFSSSGANPLLNTYLAWSPHKTYWTKNRYRSTWSDRSMSIIAEAMDDSMTASSNASHETADFTGYTGDGIFRNTAISHIPRYFNVVFLIKVR